MPPVRPADNVLVSGFRTNKTQRDTVQKSTQSLTVPNIPTALGNKSVGSLFMSNNNLYLSTGTRSTKIASASPTGIIRFEDSDGDTYVQVDDGSDDNKILLVSTSAGPNAIRFLASAGGVDIDSGTGGFSADTSGQLILRSNQSAVNAIRLQAQTGAGGIDIDSGTNGITIDSSGQIAITSTQNAANAIKINASNATSGIDMDAGTLGIAMDALGPSHFSTTAGDLTLSSASGSVVITAGKTAVNAVQIDALPAGAGGIDINAGSNGVTIDATGAIAITSTQVSTSAVHLQAQTGAGGITITCGTGGLTLATQSNGLQTGGIGNTVNTNGVSGIITTVIAGTATGATDTFTVNNNRVTASSNVQVYIVGYGGTVGTNGIPIVTADNRASGSYQIYITNVSSSSALAGALDIGYLILNA